MLTSQVRDTHRPATLRYVVALAAALVIGCLESWAQGFLPGGLKPLSNSASGWSLVAALVVFCSGARTRAAAALGAASFVLLIVGYAVVSTARGFPYSPVLWGVIGIVVGPFVGVAASWLRHRGIRAALGGGLLAGIGLGDMLYGLTTVAGSTGVSYWLGIGALSVALLGYLLVRRVRGPRRRALLVGVTLVVALLLAGLFRLI